MAIDSAALQSKFSRRLEDQLRLKRFFSKLVSEAFELHSNTLVFKKQADALHVSLQRERKEQKIIRIKGDWFSLIERWLRQHWFPPHEIATPDTFSISQAGRFRVAARLENQFIVGLVSIEPDSIAIHDLKKSSLEELLHCLSGDPEVIDAFNVAMSTPFGLTVVAARNSRQLTRAVSCLVGLSGGFYGGSLNEESVREIAIFLAQKERIVISVDGSSVVDILKALNETARGQFLPLTSLVTYIEFLPVVCSECASVVPMPLSTFGIDSLVKHAPKSYNYREGLGCAHCDQQGTFGVAPFVEAICLTDDVRSLMYKRPTTQVVREFLRESGWKSVLEQGMDAAFSGKLPLQVLANAGLLDQPIDTRPLIVEDSFFTLESHAPAQDSTTPQRPSRVRSRTESMSLFAEPTQDAFDKSSISILVVEDDPDQRNILKIVLSNEGYVIEAVENGLEALGSLRTRRPSIIITDLMMPKMNGTELVLALKADTELQSIPILVLTVINDNDREYELLDMGVDDYCEKAMPRKILLKRVENLIRRTVLNRRVVLK